MIAVLVRVISVVPVPVIPVVVMMWIVVVIVIMVVIVIVIVMTRSQDVELRRRNPAALGALEAQFVSTQIEFSELRFETGKLKAAVEQRSDQHVSAHSGEAIQI